MNTEEEYGKEPEDCGDFDPESIIPLERSLKDRIKARLSNCDPGRPMRFKGDSEPKELAGWTVLENY